MDGADAAAIVAAISLDLLGETVPRDLCRSLAAELEVHSDCSRIVTKITNGPSFSTHLIESAYVLVSGRAPTVEQHDEARQLIEDQRYDKYDIPLVLLEREAAHPSRSDASVLATAYRVAFDRVLTVAEANHWLEQVEQAGRQTAVQRIWMSHERFTCAVSGLYRLHLLREADSKGLAWGTSYLLDHGIDAVRSALVSSDEFLERAGREAEGARLSNSGELDRLQPQRPLVRHS